MTLYNLVTRYYPQLLRIVFYNAHIKYVIVTAIDPFIK